MEKENCGDHIERINPLCVNNILLDWPEEWHSSTRHELLKHIPREQIISVFKSPFCELDEFHLWSTIQYKEILDIVPKDKVIIDLWCWEAAQSFYFKDYKKYIWVDVMPMSYDDSIKRNYRMWSDRFYTPNTTHYVCTAKEFMDIEFDKLNINKEDCFVFMILVPGIQSMINILNDFPNVKLYFPYDWFDYFKYNWKVIKDNDPWHSIKSIK